jgi:hypothetical protein
MGLEVRSQRESGVLVVRTFQARQGRGVLSRFYCEGKQNSQVTVNTPQTPPG